MNNLPKTEVSKNGMVVSPHHCASDAGLEILKQGEMQLKLQLQLPHL